MPRSVIATTTVTAALLALAFCLSGCTPQPAATGSPSPRAVTASPKPTATPTPSAAPLPADVLFRITVVATAPDGATARLSETVHAPVVATTTQSADEAQLDTECDSWRTAYEQPKYLVANVITTVISGNWNPQTLVATDMAAYPVWTGDQRPYQGFCASTLPSIPGATRAVSPVGGGDADSDGGWAIYRYGFAVPTDPSSGDTPSPSPTDIVLSQCAIQLGSAASDSVFASTWPTSLETDNGLSCVVGGA